ncbi:MAG: hypothetical protein ACK4N5_07410 [Myxococcales bacterium]
MKDWLLELSLPVRPDWDSVELLRCASVQCLATVFRDRDYCDVLGMVAGELLENALKYGDWSGPGERRLLVRANGDRVEIMVRHPVAAPPVRLFALLEHLRAAPSPEAAYLDRMQRVALDPESTGGLGLARIASEARCTLEAAMLTDSVVQVAALHRPASLLVEPLLTQAP